MDLFTTTSTMLAISAIWFAYRVGMEHWNKRQRRIRERVTYMLWVMANSAPE